ncbi:MAG TPA: hypothetical protein VLT47_07875 [Anaeromyxobacteraceae bacterium]|nr:hypothetical protein [Anaeromyxobacteraceae bacterium]
MTRGAAALAALCALAAGCGNYSTEDLRFLSALPRREDLRVTIPASTGAGPAALTGLTAATAACGSPGAATVWQWAKPTSDDLNAGVSWIIGLIDQVRRHPPTHRGDDSRRWGPFDDDKHPGHELQVVIDRSWPAGADGPPAYAYRFEGRAKGDAAFTPLIVGDFRGASASHGDGDVALDFEAFWTVGVANPDTPHGSMAIGYSRSSDPVTTDLNLLAAPSGGFGAAAFEYLYSGWASGIGAFDYKFTNTAGDVLEVRTGYDAAGAGRLRVTFTRRADGATGTFDQCWDAGGCLVYVYDPMNFNGLTPTPPYTAGSAAACATLPAGVGPF